MIAFMPEPHTLLIVVQPVETGRPAPSDACRAGAWPRFAGNTQPMKTSDTSAGAIPDCCNAARMAVAPSVGVGTPVNWPRKEPIAVRLAPTMTTESDMLPPGRCARRDAACRSPDYGVDAALRQTPMRQATCAARRGGSARARAAANRKLPPGFVLRRKPSSARRRRARALKVELVCGVEL